MEKKDLGLGIGATLLGIATMIYFFNIPPKSAFFPKMISGAIIILGIVITFNAVRAMKAAPEKPEQPVPKKEIAYDRVGLKAAEDVVYYFAFNNIGYKIPTLLLIIATSRTKGEKKWKVLITAAVFVSIGLYLAFTQVFNIRFMGMFF